ncbi:hypothetical protein NLX67_03415 [Domibacillus sp. A3M-37]|uniref:hypothetical protein n=1 Tax=Domibacillus sp. A3M-37 TaxID=2962037 RepID=UPI0020B80756|nr:hypothetical protein [Domibacillus sp. A3M-37]MCP3761440.1 hypothetical protein [Domibacillus sp. A3M-37]
MGVVWGGKTEFGAVLWTPGAEKTYTSPSTPDTAPKRKIPAQNSLFPIEKAAPRMNPEQLFFTMLIDMFRK